MSKEFLSTMKLQRVSLVTKTTTKNKESGKESTKMVDSFFSAGATVVSIESEGLGKQGKKTKTTRKYLVLAVPFDQNENTLEVCDKDGSTIDGYYRIPNLSNDVAGKVTVHTSKRYSAQVVADSSWLHVGDYSAYRAQADNLRELARLEEEDRKRREEHERAKRALLAKTVLPGWGE